MDIDPGTVVANRYRISRPLGRGGMGEVFAAENIRTGRPVAVKLLRSDSKAKSSAVARFRREARAAGSINSDHVTQVLDVDEDQEHGIVLVFELLEGESLIDRLKRLGPMPFDDVYPVIEQVWMGLADAHRAGIIHRDLKPSNVFLEHRPDGSIRVKILDFGISKLPKEMGGETLTEMGQSLGTFSFMPPEQIGKAKTVDHRADIYACTTMIYQALSGQLPYSARNILVMVDMKAKSDPRTLGEAMDSVVDPRLEGFLTKGLARDPGARFQTALEALAAWRDLRPQPPVQPTPTSSQRPPPMSSQAPPPMSGGSSGMGSDSTRVDGPAASRADGGIEVARGSGYPGHGGQGYGAQGEARSPYGNQGEPPRGPYGGQGERSPYGSQGGEARRTPSYGNAAFSRREPVPGVPPQPARELPSIVEMTTDSGVATLAIPSQARPGSPPPLDPEASRELPRGMGGTIRVAPVRLPADPPSMASQGGYDEGPGQHAPGNLPAHPAGYYLPPAVAAALQASRAQQEAAQASRPIEDPISMPASSEQTRVYRPRSESSGVPDPGNGMAGVVRPSSFAPVSAADERKKPSAMPFVLGAIAFALVGFGIVALILRFLGQR